MVFIIYRGFSKLSFSDYFCGSFEYDDIKLKDMGINRLGSVFIHAI
jgi:deoxyhypusine synthase